MNPTYWLRHPHLLLSRVRYWVWERLNPDKPWMCPGTVKFCEGHLMQSMSAIEFGSGRSTAWLSRKVGRLVSIEHDAAWHERVRRALERDQVTNVDYRLISLDHVVSEPEWPSYSPLPHYVSVLDEFPDGSFDLVVVDGHYRTHCIRHCIPKLKASGYLLVDDTNLWPSRDCIPVPTEWAVVDKSTNGLKYAVVWQAPATGHDTPAMGGLT